MNEKLQYATMLEIPVSTCSVTFKPIKKKLFTKKKKVDHEEVKKELLDKINAQQDFALQDSQVQIQSEIQQPILEQVEQEQVDLSITDQPTQMVNTTNNPKKKKFRISIIGVQLAIIGVLIATIFVTSAIYPTSGVNVFLRNVFGTQTVAQTDDRIYADFAPVINLFDDELPVISDGVITFSGKGSVYAPCDGKISAITKLENGKYDIEITHSENFKSVLTGIDFAYAGLDDMVFSNIPVGYVTAGATMCFKGIDDALILDYQIIEDTVVWAV